MPFPTVKKGRVTIPATGQFRNFMFNPNEVTDAPSVNFGMILVQGSSQPVYQYGSGGERIISFELFFDGDRGRLARRNQPGVFSSFEDSLSVNNEIKWYQALLYPQEYDTQDFVKTYPYIVLLSLGNFLDAVPCLLKSAPVTVDYWTPNMDPVRATMAMSFAEYNAGGVAKTYFDVSTDLGVLPGS